MKCTNKSRGGRGVEQRSEVGRGQLDVSAYVGWGRSVLYAKWRVYCSLSQQHRHNVPSSLKERRVDLVLVSIMKRRWA